MTNKHSRKPLNPSMPRILVVDDQSSAVAVMLSLLESIGCESIFVFDGASAYRALGDHNIDLLVLDWDMPDLSGFKTLQLIESNPPQKLKTPLPYVIYSGFNESQIDIPLTHNLKFMDHWQKPIVRPEIVSQLNRFVSSLKKAG